VYLDKYLDFFPQMSRLLISISDKKKEQAYLPYTLGHPVLISLSGTKASIVVQYLSPSSLNFNRQGLQCPVSRTPPATAPGL
jgi:hypothetical protein